MNEISSTLGQHEVSPSQDYFDFSCIFACFLYKFRNTTKYIVVRNTSFLPAITIVDVRGGAANLSMYVQKLK